MVFVRVFKSFLEFLGVVGGFLVGGTWAVGCSEGPSLGPKRLAPAAPGCCYL